MRAATVVAIAAGIVVVDQATKALVASTLEIGRVVVVAPGLLNLTHVRNRGVAFGMMSGLPDPWRPLFLALLAVVIVVFLAWMLRGTPHEERMQRGALAAVIGGAIGNLHDRVRYGEVIDFVDAHAAGWHWPAFNVADSAITLGCVFLLLSSLRTDARSE